MNRNDWDEDGMEDCGGVIVTCYDTFTIYTEF